MTVQKLRLAAFTLVKYGALPEAAEVLAQILELDPENYEAAIMAKVVADPEEP
ncbi:hypothetical protein [Catenulispora rubra]|uniref:hypothetical protein n=1 Tax=Catenulispora rubra TaxID=280293 RepID=UPI001892458E|nr:hypothetical protein [Catenulispora rubra]